MAHSLALPDGWTRELSLWSIRAVSQAQVVHSLALYWSRPQFILGK
jgi:hypothetical protein